jgi:hypothetical protein
MYQPQPSGGVPFSPAPGPRPGVYQPGVYQPGQQQMVRKAHLAVIIMCEKGERG